jgi:probable rRNA maturation factor
LVILRKRVAGLNASTLEYFVSKVRRLLGLRHDVNVLVTRGAEVRLLNRRFRGIDKPTDVLSFPAAVKLSGLSAGAVRDVAISGDLVISADIARENANRLGHSVANEVKILVLHGILHLAGFDHERDNGQMARKERQLRRRLKLEPGLIERALARPLKIAERRKANQRLRSPRRRSA